MKSAKTMFPVIYDIRIDTYFHPTLLLMSFLPLFYYLLTVIHKSSSGFHAFLLDRVDASFFASAVLNILLRVLRSLLIDTRIGFRLILTDLRSAIGFTPD